MSNKGPYCNTVRWVCVYFVNDPDYYDEKGNFNGKKNVDGQNQGVECGIPLQAGTQDRRKAGQYKST